jgi:hypothetical protein
MRAMKEACNLLANLLPPDPCLFLSPIGLRYFVFSLTFSQWMLDFSQPYIKTVELLFLLIDLLMANFPLALLCYGGLYLCFFFFFFLLFMQEGSDLSFKPGGAADHAV